MIRVEVDDKDVRRALGNMANASGNPRNVLEQIGELLIDSTKQRFSTSTGPDGTPWARNSETTLLRYLGKYKGAYSKRDGRLTSTGASRAIGKKPLIGETGDLARQMTKRTEGSFTLHVGSTMIYSAMQQFGGTKAKFPRLWGDIPARPFLGISDSDRTMILDQISDYLNGAFRP